MATDGDFHMAMDSVFGVQLKVSAEDDQHARVRKSQVCK